MGLDDNISRLVETIRASSEFSKLKQAKLMLSKNPGLKKDLEEFNAGHKQLLSGRPVTKETESKIKQLNSKFESLSKVPEVEYYLKALNDFNKMLSNVYSRINEYLEKEFK